MSSWKLYLQKIYSIEKLYWTKISVYIFQNIVVDGGGGGRGVDEKTFPYLLFLHNYFIFNYYIAYAYFFKVISPKFCPTNVYNLRRKFSRWARYDRLVQPRTQGILLPISENGTGIGRSHYLKISSIWGVQLWWFMRISTYIEWLYTF
jgi:hypothetical protein